MKAPVLDTHAWVWWVHGDRRLGRGTLAALDALPPGDRPVIAAVSLWEVATLVDRGRLVLPQSLDLWLSRAADPRTVTVSPITTAIVVEMNRLPATFHRDPADRLIVATCRTLGRALLTKDAAIGRARLARRWSPADLDS